MAGRLLEKPGSVLDGASLWIGRSINEPRHAREADGARAHGAGLKCHIERGADQPFIAQTLGPIAQRQHLGMSGGIPQFDDTIAGARQYAAIRRYQDGANGHLAASGGFPGFGKRELLIIGGLLFHPREDNQTHEVRQSTY